MGKGGTKFVGEAIAHRSGRAKSTYTSKELRKNMEKFLETGVHPDIQRAQQGPSGVLYPLPDPDPHRPHVFMDLTVDNKHLGRLVIELYEDVAPAAARHLMNRCTPGSSASLLGCSFHKLLPYYALFGGKAQSAAFAGSEVPLTSRLQHNVRGAVSVSRDGAEFAISLGKSLTMDETHQVCGRIIRGLDDLDIIDDVPRSPDDTPLMRIKVVKCGATNAEGTHEALEEALTRETPEAAAARLKKESADTRNAVMEALQQGMSHKRTADEAGLGPSSSKTAAAAAAAASGAGTSGQAEAGPGSSKAAAAGGGAQAKDKAGAAAAAAAGGPSKRSKLLDSLLDDLDGSSSGGDSSGAEGD